MSRIVLQLAHEVGALATITSLIAEYGSNIDYLELIRSDKNFRTLNLDIEVHDVSHAKQVNCGTSRACDCPFHSPRN